MGRKKVNLQWISNNSSRRATYRRRCHNLMKKTGEVVTLCGVKATVVAYDGEGEPAAQPDTWPTAAEAQRVCSKFMDTPDGGSFKKSVTQESFLAARVKKLQQQVSRMELENRRREAALLLHDRLVGERVGLDGTTSDELLCLMDLVERKMTEGQNFVDRQLKEAQEKNRAAQQQQAAQPALPPPPAQQVHPEQLPPVAQHVAHPELPPPPALPAAPSSPAQMQQPDSPLFTTSDLQSLAPLDGPQPLQQEDLLADTAMNDADPSAAFFDEDDDFTFPVAGSSGGLGGFPSIWD